MIARVALQQYSFTAGMLDDGLEARSDNRAYYAGGREIRNMMGLPQGGLTQRGGLSFVAELPEAAQGARLVPFSFSTEQNYLHVFTHRRLHVYRNGVKQTDIATPWTGTQIKDMNWTQSLDTMIVVHPDVQYRKIMRRGRHDAWNISPLSIQNVPRNSWSGSRGWPRSVYLFEGRLYFGGSRSRPQTVWGSSSNNFFNFRVTRGEALDDDGVEMTMDSDRVSAVEQLYALKDFFVFTSGGLFVQSQSPITPHNFYVTRHSELPAANVRPVELDGSIVFIRRGTDGHHQSVQELVYDDAFQIYTTQDISLLAGSLIRNPVAMVARLGNESNSANHLFVVNGADGTVAVLNTRRSQQITGWTLLETAGRVLDCAVVGTTVYFLVKRRIADRDRYFIEALNEDHRLDASVKQTSPTPRTQWDGLTYLEGVTVDLRGDGAPLGTATVSNGRVSTPFPVRELEAGLAFDWVVETMPLEAQLTNGTLIGECHRIVKATIRVKDTQAMHVNGRPIAFSRFGRRKLDGPPDAYTGLKTVRFLGWTGRRDGRGETVRMQGQSTRTATILSLTTEVAQ